MGSTCAPRPSVLIVDDDTDVLETIAMVLDEYGYDPVVASGGEEAWAALEAGVRPDVILVDLMMPRGHGWNLLARIHRERGRTLPVVVMSAGGWPLLLTAASACGYIPKPVALDALLTTLRAAIDRPTDGGRPVVVASA
jgi:CheY-like chemotaxis protein